MCRELECENPAELWDVRVSNPFRWGASQSRAARGVVHRLAPSREINCTEEVCVLTTMEERFTEIDPDDVDLIVGVDSDLTTARVLAQSHFGKRSDKDSELVLAIFKEISQRRSRDDEED